ncbi:hypothetical protein [Bdellovibrio bacteriovorus]|uniref:Uncharacterized protein n=1 Tax=Bdellovibrio bacteriovorus TaxID=959 RepID=A0A1Z3N4L2_BDEBC|nr:hypothetical protein [Bdellovibrio bacteriovorus]ASD62412.1 hypothetical protein B9G79_01950 [Bdellovibrio bacteriovorus]
MNYIVELYIYGVGLAVISSLVVLWFENERHSRAGVLQERLKAVGKWYCPFTGELLPYSSELAHEYRMKQQSSQKKNLSSILFLVLFSWLGVSYQAILIYPVIWRHFLALRNGKIGRLCDSSRLITDSDLILYIDQINWSNLEDK